MLGLANTDERCVVGNGLGAGENNVGHQGTFHVSGLASDSPWGGVAERDARLYRKKVATCNFCESLAIRLILPSFYDRSHRAKSRCPSVVRAFGVSRLRSTRAGLEGRSEETTSEIQSLMRHTYAV